MKKGRLGIALCIAFSCTALAAIAGTPDEESARASFCPSALHSKLKIGLYTNPDNLPFAKEDNTSDLSKGYSAFKGVMIHGLEHFSLTMAKSQCSPNAVKGWTALNNVLIGAVEQLEVTMDYHICLQKTDPNETDEMPSDLTQGYAAFKGVMTYGFEHFSLTMTNSSCSPNSLKGWTALNNVMAGALEQLEVTMDSHVCPQATPPITPPPLPENSPPMEIPVGVIVLGETPEDSVLTVCTSEKDKDSQTVDEPQA